MTEPTKFTKIPDEGNIAREGKLALGPIIDEVKLESLYELSTYEVETHDGWTLVITRYKPIEQIWHQPLLNSPLLLVHGFSQNRHAWTAGEFVKNMLYFGADIHILELRGHGLSSRRKQEENAAKGIKPLPSDIDFGWGFDSYFLYDVPAAIDAVKKMTGNSGIFYAGHSMGGMLGYGLASQRNDILGLATIGSPVDIGKESVLVQLAAWAGLALHPAWTAAEQAVSTGVRLRKLANTNIPLVGQVMSAATKYLPEKPLPARVVPMDLFLGRLYKSIMSDEIGLSAFIPGQLKLFNPDKVEVEDIDWLLQEGGEREPLSVLQTFAKFVRRREVKCYTTGYDFKANFSKIKCPITIIFGDADVLAGVKSTRSIYLNVSSDYAVWRPVRGNSHLDITMGLDIRQICYDLKNMMEYSISHRGRAPRLPRSILRHATAKAMAAHKI